jgi:hypothetical protein
MFVGGEGVSALANPALLWQACVAAAPIARLDRGPDEARLSTHAEAASPQRTLVARKRSHLLIDVADGIFG